MTAPATSFGSALAVADAVLFEGYLLYPYRASAQKNQVRWQFGVLSPRAASEAGSGEPWAAQTECVAEANGPASLRVAVRFLQVERRLTPDPWDEGEVRTAEITVPLAGGPEQLANVTMPGTASPGRRSETIEVMLRVSCERFAGPYPLWKVRVRAENVTDWDAPGPREEVLLRSMVATHSLIGIGGGRFLSLTDPPEFARMAAAECRNEHTWPVLAGDGPGDVLLSSPIILADHPRIAPESPGELFDGTEIDEILTLRTMTLTEEEKREARATDPRAAALIDRVDALPGEVMERLHGAVRYLRSVTGPAADEPPVFITPEAPWWDPGADESVSPETDTVLVDGVAVGKGSRVRLRPRLRGTDAQDMFLTGREATVEAVLFDVDGSTHLAVTIAGDPAAELHRDVGRFRYFAPSEVEPLP